MEKLRARPVMGIAAFLRDALEIYLPMLAFAVMFVVFILQIFFRYVLRQPLQWAYEVTVSCYLWLVLLGACYAQRERKHVSFNMITDKLSVKPRAFVIFLGNLLMLIAFAYAFLPSAQFVFYMKRQQTAALKIGLDLIYLAYIPFMIFMMVYFVRDMIVEFRVFTGMADPDEVKAFDKLTRDDYEDMGSESLDVLEQIKEDVT